MGDCDILVMVMVLGLASCTAPKPGQQSSLLPPGQDGATGTGPTRRPGDPQVAGAVDSGASADVGPVEIPPDAGYAPAADAAMLAAPDTSSSPPPDSPPAPAADAATPVAPDTSPSPPPDAPPAPAADADGITWDANRTLTDCGIAPPWYAKSSYSKNQQVVAYGHIFECIGDPPYHLTCVLEAYEPGKPGGPWMEAWVDYGRCR